MNEIPNDTKLNTIFDEAYKLYESFDEPRDNAGNSPEFQESVKSCISQFEDATRLVSLSGMFSKNENYEEISTENLKYLLLPFFLAQTTMRLCIADRKNIVDVAKIYYEDFLKRCEEYELFEGSGSAISKATNIVARDELQRLQQMAQQRNTTIQMYQKKKELKDQIKQLKIAMASENVEDEIKRDFYMKLLKSCILDSQDEIKSLEQEYQILDHIAQIRHDNPDMKAHASKRPARQTEPLKPIIITKDAAQKAVYGLGYPSMPTYTVQEFYDQRVADGIFPSDEQVKQNSLQNRVEIDHDAKLAKEEEEKEKKIENDDPLYLEQARNLDEYKDDHRRGYGNRHNRS